MGFIKDRKFVSKKYIGIILGLAMLSTTGCLGTGPARKMSSTTPGVGALGTGSPAQPAATWMAKTAPTYPLSAPTQAAGGFAPSPVLVTPGTAATAQIGIIGQAAVSTQTPPTRGPVDFSHPKVETLVKGLTEPDDLLLAPDGSIFISDVGDGTLRRFTPAGQLEMLISGLSEPEGMILLPDGSLLIVEQGKNRLLLYDLQNQSTTPFLSLKNETGKAGVDGIALDTFPPVMTTLTATQTTSTHPAENSASKGPWLIIPDSPNGNLLSYDLDSHQLNLLAHGFNRPTAAWVEPDGSLLVVDENAGTLIRLSLNGSMEVLSSRLPTPDDVIEDSSGNIFVNTLGDGSIHVITPSRQEILLVSGLSSPQGECFDAQGNLIVADTGHHRLVKIVY